MYTWYVTRQEGLTQTDNRNAILTGRFHADLSVQTSLTSSRRQRSSQHV